MSAWRCTVAAALLGTASSANHGYRSSAQWLPRDAVITQLTGEQLVADDQLPVNFDWRSVGGVNYVTSDVNQHIPQYCGACWIHGTVAALNDRIKVMRRAEWPDVMLGRQAILNCIPPADGKGPNPGCDGGDSWMIHKYLLNNSVPDESCMPYQAKNMECVPMNVCRNCVPGAMVQQTGMGEACFPVDHWTGFGVSQYGNVSGEVAMMKEIFARGPIACSAATDDDFMLRYSENAVKNEGVYVTDKKFTQDQIDHVMEIAGWGVSPNGVKYWVVRNSWGTYWGEMGWAKIKRGVNQMLFESSCDWAVPKVGDLDNALQGRVMGDYIHGISSKLLGGGSVPDFPQNEPGGAAGAGLLGAGTAAAAAKSPSAATPAAAIGAGVSSGVAAFAALGGLAGVSILWVMRRRAPRQVPLLG